MFRSLLTSVAMLGVILASNLTQAATPSCSAIFPDGAQSHTSNTYVRFDWGAGITGSPDNIIAASSIRDNSGGSSCDSSACSASGSPVDKLVFDDFVNSNDDVRVSSGVSQTLQPGVYDDFKFQSNSNITLEPGDYILSGSLQVYSNATINVSGNGLARLFVSGSVTLNSGSSVNTAGTAANLFVYAKRDIKLQSSSSMNALVYSEDNVHLYNRATLNGAATGAYVFLGSSNSRINYDESLVANAEFGDMCGGGVTLPPATDDGPAAGSCEAIFPDGVQTHSTNGRVTFNWRSKVLNSPDNIITTPNITDNSGGTSCDSEACSASFSSAESIDFDDYSSGGNRISMSYNSDLSLSPGTYASVTVAGQSTLTLSPGDYYISGNFTMDWQSDLELSGSGPVRIFVNGFFSAGGQSDINKGGEAENLFVIAKRGFTLNTQDEAVGVFYTDGNVSLGHQSELIGAVSGEDVALHSTGATVDYDQSAIRAAEFGDMCSANGNTINPPIIDYRFDACSLDDVLKDSGEYSYHGVPTDVVSVEGKIGQAADFFESAQGEADIPAQAFDGLEDFSVSTWINLTDSATQQSPNVLLTVAPGSFSSVALRITSYGSTIVVETNESTSTLTHSQNLVGSWNHIGVRRAGSSICLFVNGIQASCNASAGAGEMDVSSSDDVWLARYSSGRFFAQSRFEGVMDEFKVFNYALSDAQLLALYGAENTGTNYDQTDRTLESCLVTIPDPVLDLPMDALSWSGSENEVLDLSPSANHGKAIGGTSTTDLGQVCRAGVFDGDDHSVEIENLSDHLNGTATLSFWIKTDQSGANTTWQSPAVAGIEQHGGTNDIFWGFIHRDGAIGVAVGNDASTRSTQSIDNNKWHHVVLSRDSSTHEYQIYLNGRLNKSGTLDNKTVTLTYDYIGNLENSHNDSRRVYLDADLDELLIFDVILDEDQVALIYERQSNEQRWDGTTPVCETEASVDHYGITASSPALTCEYSTVEITAYDSAGAAVVPDVGTQMTLSTSVTTDAWALASGAGSLNGSVYTFAGSENSASFKLYSSAAVSNIDIDVSDGTATDPDDGGSKDERVSFVDAALRFYADGVADSIGTQLSGKASNEGSTYTQTIKLRAVGTDAETGACTALTPGTANVGFGYECSDPNACALATNGALVSGNAINQGTLSTKGSFVTQSLTFDANGETEITLNYLDAGEIKLHAAVDAALEEGGNAASLEGSSNAFVVKPAGLCVQATTANSACVSGDASCSAFVAAGADFSLEVSAKRWSQAAETSGNYCTNTTTENFALTNIALTHDLVAPIGGQSGNLGVTSVDVNTLGTVTETAQTINEVGVFTITATPPSYLGETIPTVTSANIGRFTPANFQLVSAQSDVADACQNTNAFSYMGQAFSASGRLQAQNLAGGLTSNYVGDFVQLDDSAGSLGYGALAGTTNLSSRLIGVSGAFAASSTFSWVAGEGDFTTSLIFSRASAIDGEHVATLGFSAQDDDGVLLTGLDMDVDNDATDDFVELGTSRQRYGRLVVANSYGPETAVLSQVIRTEYYDGERFVVNTDDGDSSVPLDCSLLTDAQISLRVIDDDSSPDDTLSLSAGTLTGITLDSGATDTRLAVQALDQGLSSLVYGDGANGVLGAGNTGQVEVTIDVPAYLEFDWDGADSDDEDPTGTITFGNYRGNDNIIFWLER